MKEPRENRINPQAELRIIRSEGEPAKVAGYAAVFNRDSDDMGFIERIAPGAFKKALKNSDTRALFNHDSNIVLGRESAGTLTLKEDEKGLYMEVVPPDTQLVRDMVMVPIERGDITQQSFGFTVAADKWEDVDKELPRRTILEVRELFDVSPVTFPAYPDTSVALRSLDKIKEDLATEARTTEATLQDEKKNLEIDILTIQRTNGGTKRG